jgi:hypothetical protein
MRRTRRRPPRRRPPVSPGAPRSRSSTSCASTGRSRTSSRARSPASSAAASSSAGPRSRRSRPSSRPGTASPLRRRRERHGRHRHRAQGAGRRPGDEVVTTALSFFATAEAISLAGAEPGLLRHRPAHRQPRRPPPRGARHRTNPGDRPRPPLRPARRHGRGLGVGPPARPRRGRGLRPGDRRHLARPEGRHARRRRLPQLLPSKNLGALGDAGAILAGDADLARRCRLLANHGGARKYEHEVSA